MDNTTRKDLQAPPEGNYIVPETVRALKKIENSLANNDLSPKTPTQKQGNLSEPNKPDFVKNSSNKNNFYIVFILFLVVLIIFSILLSILFKKGTVAIKGQVLNAENNAPVSNAVITINEEDSGTFSDIAGLYEIKNLKPGTVTLSVKAPGFEPVTKKVSLTLGLLGGGTSVVNFQLKPLEKVVVEGKIMLKDTSITPAFTDAKVVYGEIEENIKADGSFKITLPINAKEIVITGSEFYDFIVEIDAKNTTNLGEILATPASDINAFFIDYITGEPLKPTVQITDIPQNKVQVQSNGNLKIADVESEKKYNLEISLDGYLTKTQSIETHIGDTELFTIKLTPKGKKTFWGIVNQTPELFISNYDGSDLVQITQLGYLNPIGGFFDSTTNSYYFQSDHEKFKNSIKGYAYLPYSINLDTPLPKRLIKNFDDLGYIFTNFNIEKYAQIVKAPNNSKIWNLEVVDFNGTENLIIDSSSTIDDEKIKDVIFTEDGSFIFYVKKQDEIDKLYSYNLKTNTKRLLFENNLIIVTDVFQKNVMFINEKNELMVVNVDNYEIKTIQPQVTGFDYQFDRNNPNFVLFLSYNRSATLINILDISQLELKTLLEIEQKEVIDLYYENEYYFYRTENELFMFDRNKPQPNVKIFEGEIYDNRDISYNI
jgi:hypothetical protein